MDKPIVRSATVYRGVTGVHLHLVTRLGEKDVMHIFNSINPEDVPEAAANAIETHAADTRVAGDKR